MQNNSKLASIILVTILISSLSIAIVAAQYYTTQTKTNITIGSDGKFAAQESSAGVSYVIVGAAGATGSVTADIYGGNPQSSATIPTGVSLSHFVVITFSMNAQDFASATVVLTYSDSDVQNLKAPYSVYKYDATSNSYVALPSTVDSSAKTITVMLNSITDPLLAIGGSTITSPVTSGGISSLTWGIIVAAIIIVVLVAVFTVTTLHQKQLIEKTLK